MPTRPRPPQGEALVTWALWGALLGAIVVTYARLEPADLYHVSRDGLAGGLSRALVEMNFPIALAAIGLVLVAPLAPVWPLLVVAAALLGIVLVEGNGPQTEHVGHAVGAH